MRRERSFLGGLAPRIGEGRHEHIGQADTEENLIERDQVHRS